VIYEDTSNITSFIAGIIDDSNIASNEVVFVNGDGGEVRMVDFSGFYSEVLVSGENKLSGVTIGDIDPDHAGNEAVVVGMTKENEGDVYVAWREGNSWSNERIELKTPTGELLTPVIGDFDNDAGTEMAIVGMLEGAEGPGKGQVTMVSKSGDEFVTDQIIVYPRFLHGAAIGDFLEENEGDELIVTSFTDKGIANITVVTNNTEQQGGGWSVTVADKSDGNVRKALFADIDPTHDGDELYVVDKAGKLTMIYQNATGFYSQVLWTDPGTPGLARIAIGDADNDGELEIIVGGDSNNVGLVERTSEGIWVGKVIWSDINKIRGLAVGDFEPNHAGNEIATFGYSKRVSMLALDESTGQWKTRTIFTDTGRGHDLAVGDLDPLHDGNELIMSGFSKNLTMVAFSDDFTAPDFKLTASDSDRTVSAGKSVVYNVSVESLSNFNDLVYLTLDGLPAGIDIQEFSSQTLIGHGDVQIKLRVSPAFDTKSISFNVNARGSGITKSLKLDLTVTESTGVLNVISVQPARDAKDIDPENLAVKIIFDSDIDLNSVTKDSVLITASGGVYFTGSYELSSDKKTVTIKTIHAVGDEEKKLPANSKINITITEDVADVNGNSLQSDYSWEFSLGEAEDEEGVSSIEGLALSLAVIVVIIIIIVIVGIIFGRKRGKEEQKSDKEEERK
jgi:hypothetical protein